MKFNFDENFQKLMTDHQLDTVIICGHMNPDGDACGSVLGLAHYIRSAYPEYRVFPYLAENLDRGPKQFTRTDTVFDPFKKPVGIDPETDRFLVIVCDTATKARLIGMEYYEKAAASIVLDHHASNEGYGHINNTTISEACAHNVYNCINKEKLTTAAKQPHPNAADYLYLGLIHDTGCFDRANPELFEAAADLIRMGVNHREILETRKIRTLSDKEKEAWLLRQAKRGIKEEVAYIYVDRATAEENEIGYEDIHPISEVLRDCSDIEMAFSMFEESPSMWRCSFRSDGIRYNVNKMVNPFGGGGHAGAAGLRLKTDDPQTLLKDLLEAADKITEK